MTMRLTTGGIIRVLAILVLSAPAFGATMSIGAPSAARTAAGPITYTVTYSGATAVTLSTSDITLNTTGTATGSVAVTGAGTATRTVTISSITGDGTLGITIATNTGTPTPINGATSTTFIVDNTAPTVSSVQTQTIRTINVTFSESMLASSGVTTAANYTLSGAGMGTLAAHPNSVALVSGSTYRLTWTTGEMVNGATVQIAVVTAKDLAGNAISSSGQHVNGGIGVVPTITAVAVITGLTVDVTFSESMLSSGGVTTAANYTVSGAGQGTLAANPTSVALVSGNKYRLTWSTGEMMLGGTVEIAGANATDLAGNPVASSAQHTNGGIGVRPTVSSVAVQSATTVNVVFSEAMGGTGVLTAANYTISGAGIGSLTSTPDSVSAVSATTYQLTWNAGEMLYGADITITVTSDTVADLAGNTVTATNSATHTGGGIGVRPVLVSDTVVTGHVVNVTFDEPMTGAGVTTAANYTVSGTGQGTLSANPDSVALDSGNTYSLTWNSGEMCAGGDITITITSGSMTDVIGNALTTGNTATEYGTGVASPPLVSSVNVAAALVVDVTFSEAMLETGTPNALTASCYSISGSGAGSLVASNPATVTSMGGAVYRLTWTSGEMVQGGDITITVTGVKDASGNPITTLGTGYVGTHTGGAIGTQPTVSSVAVISGGQTGAVVDVTFSETMNNVGAMTTSNYTISGSGRGTLAANPASVSYSGSKVYRLRWTSGEMKNGGDITVAATAANVKDLAGNTLSVSANSATHASGAVGALPSVTITSTTTVPPGYTNETPIPVTVTFSESVSGFTSADVVKANATISNFTGSGATYTFGLVPTSTTAVVTVDIAANAAQDDAGNQSTVATQFTRNFDSTAPSVTNVTAMTNRSIRVIFSKFMGNGATTPANYTVSGTGKGSLADNPTTVTAVGVEPANTFLLTWDAGEMYGLGTVTVTVTDAKDNTSGNPVGTNNNATGNGIGVAPTVTIDTPSPTTTNVGPVVFPIVYADADSGVGAITLSDSDVTLNTSGTATGTVAVSSSGDSSTVIVSDITGTGALSLSIAAGVVADGVGNLALAPADSAAVTVDNTAPTVAIGSPSAASTTGADISFDVTYTGANTITLSDSDVTLNTVGTVTGTAAVATVDATTMRVTISGITGAGLLGISIATDTATDTAGNYAPAAGPSSTCTVLNWAPILSGVAVNGSRAVDVTFNKAMGAGVTTVDNYSVSGTGLGNLTAVPGSVTLVSGNTYRLAWADGEMFNGGDITVTATGMEDTNGQVLDTGDNSAYLTTVKSDTEIYISYREPVGTGAATPANYTLSGADQGTLAANPNAVTQQGSTNTYLLSWTTGAMTNSGAAIAVAVANVADARGLALTEPHNIATHAAGAVGAGPTVSVGFPSKSSTNVGPVSYTVSYSDVGSGIGSVSLAAENITLNKTGTADATVSVSSGATSTVTLSDITGDGTLGISILAGTAVDAAGNSALSAGPSTTFTVDNTGPAVVISAPSAASTTGASVSYTVTYTGASSIVLTSDLITLNQLGSATATVTVSGSGVASRTVTLSDITGIGALGISLAADTAYDSTAAGSPAAGPSALVEVLNDAPVLQDVVAQSGGQTINVTFSKPMASADITTPANYVISGAGLGNLSAVPDSVVLVGGNTYQLIWNSGEMIQGSDITATVSNVTDSMGQALDTSDNSVYQTTVKSDTEVYVSFRHAMGASALTAANYTASGADLGTLTEHPDIVMQLGSTSVYVLAWLAGAMTNSGAALGVAVANILDARGQTMDTPNNQFTQVGGGVGSRPTATIGAPSATAANTGPVTYTVDYADVGSGLTSIVLSADNVTLNKTGTADGTVSVENGTASSTITIDSITGEGSLGISVGAGAALDLAGNQSVSAGPSATFVVDNTAPSIVFSAPSETWTTAGPVTYTVTYSDAGSGMSAINLTSDMVVLNMTGTARGDVEVSGAGLATRTITISNISGNGTLSLYMDEDSAVDLAGNQASASGTNSTAFSVDNRGPDITISAPSVSYWRNGQPDVTYTVTYSDVAGVAGITLASGDINLHRTDTADASSVTVTNPGPANTRLVTLLGITGDGTLSISINSNTATDATGNSSLAASESTAVTIDNTPVGVVIGAPSVSATRTGPATFTVTYTGASAITLASGVRAGNVFGNITLVRTGSADATTVSVSGSGTSTRTVVISGTSGGGTLGIAIAADTAADAAGNGADVPTASATFTVDNVAPTVSSITPQADARSIDVTFNEAMGLGATTAANYTVSGAGAGNLAANPTSVALVSGSTYRLTWTAGEMLQGSSVTVTAANAQDVAGNTVGAPNSATAAAIGIVPTLTIGAPSVTATRNGPITFALTYNDTTSGIGAITLSTSHITVNKTGTANCTWSVSGTGLSQRTVTLANVSGDGTLGITVASATAADAAGNVVAGAGPSATVAVDRTVPDVPVISAPSVAETRTGPVSFTVTYADAGSGIGAITLNTGDITLNTTGGVTGSVTVSGTGTATRTVTVDQITGNGTLGISLAAGTATDTMGNYAPAAGPSATVVVDETAPAISIGAPSATLRRGNNGQTVTYLLTYTGQTTVTLSDSDVTLNRTGTANGAVAVSGAGATRTVTVSSLTGDGTLGITVAAGTASDAAGNLTDAVGPSDTFTVDSTCSMAIGAASATDTQTGPITYTVTYTGASAVTLATGNVTLNKTGTANGTVAVTGAGTATRTVTISSITGDGTLGITIAAGTGADTAGNASNTATSATFNVDNTKPALLADPAGVVVYSGETDSVTAEVDVTFSESMDSAGVTEPTNYSVSGNGAGSLPTHPYNVALVSGNKYRLTWLDGQMIQGGDITIAVNTTNVRDRIGNTMGTPSSGTDSGGGIGGSPATTIGAPSLLISRGETVSYQVTYASPGGIGAITLTADDITLSKTGSAYATVAVEGTESDYRTVVLSNISGVGTLRIWVAANTATDNWGNTLPAAGPSTRFSVDTSGAKSNVVLYVESGSALSSADGSAENPFRTLGAAIEASGFNANDTIIVGPGVYNENVALKSGTILIGESGANDTILAGVSAAVPVLTLAQNCEVGGLTILGTGDGVAVDAPEGSNSVVTNCIIRDAATGVEVGAKALLAFMNNTVYGNTAYGVLVDPSAALEPFKNNILYANGVGLAAEEASIASNGFNCYSGNGLDTDGTALATTDFVADPAFVDESGVRLELSADSPCLYAGEGRVTIGADDGTQAFGN